MDLSLLMIICASALLASASAGLGCVVILSKQALVADTISNAALPGMVVAYTVSALWGITPSLIVTIPVSALTCAIAVGIIYAMQRHARVESTAAIGATLAGFLGLGLVTISIAQQFPAVQISSLRTLMYGSVVNLNGLDALMSGVFAIAVLITLIIKRRAITAILFQRDYALTIAQPVLSTEAIIMVFLVLTLTINLKLVGPITGVGLIVLPVASVMPWCKRVSSLMVSACIIACVTTIVGVLISRYVPRVATGPAIILCELSALLISGLCAMLYKITMSR